DGGSRDDRVSNGANGGDSRMVLAYLNAKVKDRGFKPDVLMLNCGLHDIKKDVKTLRNQVSIQDYERNLEAIIKLLDENDIRLIWIRTTQVVDSIHNAKKPREFTRHAADERAYNAVADK